MHIDITLYGLGIWFESRDVHNSDTKTASLMAAVFCTDYVMTQFSEETGRLLSTLV